MLAAILLNVAGALDPGDKPPKRGGDDKRRRRLRSYPIVTHLPPERQAEVLRRWMALTGERTLTRRELALVALIVLDEI